MNTKINRAVWALAFSGFFIISGEVLAKHPYHLNCGDTILVDTQLHDDLVDCPKDGLLIGMDGITLNLNGHTIDGIGFNNTSGSGVAVNNHKGVTIKNGHIREFYYGVGLNQSTAVDASGLILTANLRGINLANSSGNVIEKNAISGNALDGIRLGGSGGNIVQKNHIINNVFGVGIADGSHNNLILKNQILDGVTGLFIYNDCNGNKLLKNEVSDNEQVGISVELNSNQTLLAKNTTENNRWNGILIGDGLFDVMLIKNESNANKKNGIEVNSAGTVLTDNSANKNALIGIKAVVGVINGGDNQAKANGVKNCVNLSCN